MCERSGCQLVVAQGEWDESCHVFGLPSMPADFVPYVCLPGSHTQHSMRFLLFLAVVGLSQAFVVLLSSRASSAARVHSVRCAETADAFDFMKTLTSAPETIEFEQTMAAIEKQYLYTPKAFSCGKVVSPADKNQGSAKLFSFAKLNKLSKDTTLQCFGRYYREDVLKNPR